MEEPLVLDFQDDRIRLDNWHPRVRKRTDVPVPHTILFDVSLDEDDHPTAEFDKILSKMKALNWERAFIRSMYKSAQLRLTEGSMIHERTRENIERTFHELMTQHIMMEMSTGGRLALREYLDLNFCAYSKHLCHPEVRFFLEDGEIDYHFGRMEKEDFPCDHLYDSAESVIDSNISKVKSYATEVAEEFDEIPWCIDFVMDWNGDWYLTDMAPNGVYYNHGKEEWMNLCGHDEDKGPVHEHEMPEPPEE